MTNKKIQFIPGNTEAMREYAIAQYSNLLTNYDVFQIDDEYLDAVIEEVVPQKIQVAVNEALGRASFGCRPLLESDLLDEALLVQIVARLDAIVEFVETGEEFNMWCEFYQENDGTISVVTG